MMSVVTMTDALLYVCLHCAENYFLYNNIGRDSILNWQGELLVTWLRLVSRWVWRSLVLWRQRCEHGRRIMPQWHPWRRANRLLPGDWRHPRKMPQQSKLKNDVALEFNCSKPAKTSKKHEIIAFVRFCLRIFYVNVLKRSLLLLIAWGTEICAAHMSCS